MPTKKEGMVYDVESSCRQTDVSVNDSPVKRNPLEQMAT